MSDKIRSPFPRDIDIPVRFLDRFTVRDVLRLGVAVSIGVLVGDLLGAAMGLTVGALSVFVKPYGIPVENHLRNLVVERYSSGSDWKTKNDSVRSVSVFEDGTVVGAVRVYPCDIELVSERVQRANRGAVRELIEALDFPVEIHSIQSWKHLSEFPGSESMGKETGHYVVVRVSGSEDDLEQVVADRCRMIAQMLSTGDIRAEVVNMSVEGIGSSKPGCCDVETDWTGYGVSCLSGPEWRKVLYVSNYPREVALGWISDVLNCEGLVDVVQVVEPISEKQRSKLSHTAGKLRLEHSSSLDPGNQSELQRAKQDAEDMLGVEAEGGSLVNYGVYIVVKGEGLEKGLEEVKTELRKKRIEFKKPVFRMQKAARTESPFARDLLGETLVVPAEAAAAGFPFNTYDRIQSGGVTLGTDSRNGMPVVLDRFSWDSPHIARMGMTGSGKTVGTMLEVLRSFQVDRGIDIRILDPKPDYGRLVELLGGETCVVDEVDLESYEPGSVCRYVVDDPSRDNSERLVETVRHIHRECCTDDRKCLVVVDEAHRLLKISEGADALSRLVWEGRSSSVGVSLLTQNAEDLTQSVAGRNILRNTGCYIFMRHQSVETEAIDFFDLSEAESAELHNLATGSNAGFSQGLVRGPVNTTLCIEMDERESEELID